MYKYGLHTVTKKNLVGSLLLVCIMLGSGCRPATQQTTLRVFAAASLTDAISEVGTAFEATHPNVSVRYNFAGSSVLATQIIEGAQPAVFLSANDAQAQRIVNAGLTAGTLHPFTANQLVVAIPLANPGGIAQLDDLTNPNLMLVTAADGVPIRSYTDTMLGRIAQQGFDVAALRANIVSEETNVRQVVGKIALGEADAAIVYQSDVTLQIADAVTALDIIPTDANVRTTYPAVILPGQQLELAQAYVEFLQSDEAQAIFTTWGFLPIDP